MPGARTPRPNICPQPTTGFNPSYKINSAVGGLYGGYNYQIGSAVLGIEADIEAANIRGGFNDPLVGGAGITLLDWQGSPGPAGLRGRQGDVPRHRRFGLRRH